MTSKSRVLSSSAFKSKHKLEVEKLGKKKLLELINDLRVFLQNEEYADVKLNLGSQFTCFHKCIAFTLAPELLSDIQMDKYDFAPDQLQEKDISNLALIYNPDESIINTFQDFSKIGFQFKKLLLADRSDNWCDVSFQLDDGQLFHCHKSIVSSRSHFFKAMLYGSWKESTNEIVKISAIKSDIFKCLLDYIYYANPELPEEIDIVEIMMVQDMLGIEGFKDVIMHHLRMYYFHYFHQPCELCIVRLTKIYNFLFHSQLLGYEDLVKACDQWFSKYFAKILVDKNLLKIPINVREIVVEKTLDSINPINIIGFIKDCTKAKASLPNVKWGVAATKLLDRIEANYQKIICGKFSEITIQAGFAVLFLEENNKHVSKMIFEMIETSLKEYMNVENTLTIYLQLVYLQSRINKQYHTYKDKDLSHSQQFLDNCGLLTKEFVRKNFFKVQQTKFWNDLEEHQKKELSSKSGFIFN